MIVIMKKCAWSVLALSARYASNTWKFACFLQALSNDIFKCSEKLWCRNLYYKRMRCSFQVDSYNQPSHSFWQNDVWNSSVSAGNKFVRKNVRKSVHQLPNNYHIGWIFMVSTNLHNYIYLFTTFNSILLITCHILSH